MGRKTQRLVLDGTNPSVVEKMAARPTSFLHSTSLTVGEFRKLCDTVKEKAGKLHRQQHKDREIVRKYGAGRTHLMPFQDRLCACLMVMRGASKHDLSHMFDVSPDTIRRAYNEFMKVLAACLKTPQRIYWHVTHAKKDDDIRKWMNPEKGAIDGVVFKTTKPPSKDVLKEHARRGKGVGVNVLTNIDADGMMVSLSKCVPASKNDTWLYKKARNPRFLAWFKASFTDRGFFGAEKDGRVKHVHGIKRLPGKKLSEEDRAINSYINSQKYQVEQINAFIKKFGCLDGISWKDKKRIDAMLQVICGLINFRTECRKNNPLDWGHKSRPPHERVQKPKGFTVEKMIKRLRGDKSSKN